MPKNQSDRNVISGRVLTAREVTLGDTEMQKSIAFLLMLKILEVVKESGANSREAQSALRAAEAMLPEANLRTASALTVET
jgi:hypothetical protein